MSAVSPIDPTAPAAADPPPPSSAELLRDAAELAEKRQALLRALAQRQLAVHILGTAMDIVVAGLPGPYMTPAALAKAAIQAAIERGA